jgi:hypothetical protein
MKRLAARAVASPLASLTLAAAASVHAAAPEPAVQRQTLEDDQVRIEELRVRGLNQRLVVKPKVAGAREYEIVPADPGRDATPGRTSAGQRVWRLFAF